MDLKSFSNEDYSNEEVQALIRIKTEKEEQLKGVAEEIKNVRNEIGNSNALLKFYKQLAETNESIDYYNHQSYEKEEQNNVILLKKLQNTISINNGKITILEREINALERILKQYKQYSQYNNV